MFGRIFGRGKDDLDQAVCAECGRTLLAGEWTQTVIDDRGDERLICSLCGQAYAGPGEPVASAPAPANNGRMRETRSGSAFFDEPTPEAAAAPEPPLMPAATPARETRDTRAESDAFWQALKDKDTHIEQLKAELARAEAERQELAGRFARLGAVDAAAEVAPEPGSLTGDSSEPGERTWGETPAEFAAEMAALREAESVPAQPGEIWDEPAPAEEASAADMIVVEAVAVEEAVEAAAGEAVAVEEAAEAAVVEEAAEAAEAPATALPAGASPTVFEDTQPIDIVAEDEDASTGEIAGAEASAELAAADAKAAEASSQEPAPESAAEADAAAASLTLLQRGVDLLNVSRVPRKIAETNEQLGLPHVHAAFDGEVVGVTFMWTMGWYRFDVDLDSGEVGMADRGYEELTLPPNAGVRADGTVQLAPAQISRAAAQRVAQAPPEAAPAQPAPVPMQPATDPVGPETPREAAQKPPEFLSKSLLGQRSDDESASWEQTQARDFDWDR
jgi:hypothetical protein